LYSPPDPGVRAVFIHDELVKLVEEHGDLFTGDEVR
jgi:hypothetical protein